MITCYLDSQDYSALTDPKLDAPERRQITDALRELARSKQVRFFFSAAAISEAVPLQPDAAYLAELKADFLSELCGANALISFDRLVFVELTALANRAIPSRDICDPHGRWFPEIAIDEEPSQPWERVRAMAEEEMKAMGLSRQERRAKSRALIKNGKPRQILTSQLAQQDPRVFAAELIKKYPMRPEYAEVMGKYALGRASEIEVNEALINSLADPRWMMRWFTTQHALASPIAEIVRKPGRELGELMRSLAEVSAHWASSLRDAGIDTDPTSKHGAITLRWQEMEAQQLVSIAHTLARNNGIELGSHEAKDVITSCPGMSTVILSLYSSVWANVGGGRKEQPSDSQPVDALHAFYAPYVDVFRADRFMAPHIQKYVQSVGTTVVPRLSQLVLSLEEKLR
ncbi:MAG: hypothetical protein O9337_05240 [Acidovorax sp.]|uniref:hypothetical protein n=1 Tax=Acidovorax sp. TaxID=1872122 RepID=UPI0022C46101|nr:hypothetical protein [Acidovorax sp.]MCZ8218805.1 hypothetical protein [Acidovorax sp.]